MGLLHHSRARVARLHPGLSRSSSREVMGNAEADGTEVIAERMIRWFFISNNDGRGAAIAVVLFIAIIPVMVWNIRKFREEEAIR